jgi:hypothetical protein
MLLSSVCYAQDSPDFIKELRGHLEYNETMEDYNPDYVYLEPDNKKFINISEPQSISSKPLNLQNKNFNVFDSKIKETSSFSGQEHDIRAVYGSISETHGKISFGTEYGSYLDDGEINYTTGVYTKFNGKHAALKLAVKTETGNSYAFYNDKIVIAPEWKITKRLSLVDVLQTDIKQVSQKNELVLRYNPKIKNHIDNLFLELGAGQTFREQNYVKSSIRFSTRFNF